MIEVDNSYDHSLLKTPRLVIYESDSQIIDRIEENMEVNGGLESLLSDLTAEKRKELVQDAHDLIDLYKMLNTLSSRENAVFFEARESDNAIGYIAFKKCHSELPEIQISLLPTHQHQGYGFEFLSAVLRYGFNMRPDIKFAYRAGPYNSASIALVEKIGGILQPANSAIEGYFFKTYFIDMKHLSCE